MSRICELMGIAPMFGNNVSKSLRRTRRVFAPNLHKCNIRSHVLQENFRLLLSTRAKRTLNKEKYGSLDQFLLTRRGRGFAALSPKVKKICRRLRYRHKVMLAKSADQQIAAVAAVPAE